MADTAFGLASEATTRYTCVMHCNSILYSKLRCISVKIKVFLFYISWFARALYTYVSDAAAAVFHNQGESASLKKLS